MYLVNLKKYTISYIFWLACVVLLIYLELFQMFNNIIIYEMMINKNYFDSKEKYNNRFN